MANVVTRVRNAIAALRDMPARSFLASIFGGSTVSGVTVNEMTALSSPAVYAAVRVLAESVASLPLITYRRTKSGKERAMDHPLYRLLHEAPNSELTSFEWIEAKMSHLLLWGNAYDEIELNKRGDVIGLWPLPPHRVTPMRSTGGQLYYHYQLPNNTYTDLLPEQVSHMRGLSYDGLVGYSPIAIARQTIGASLAIDRYGAAFFGNGARPGVALEHPGRLSEPALKKLRESWNDAHQGVDNAHRVAVLEEGMKLSTYSTSPNDAQFLETRQFQISEVARIFRVPPHLIGDLSRATFSNIEHQGLEFVTHSLRPWLVRIEQAFQRDLVGRIEGNVIKAEFLVEGLLRGDQKSRYEAYAIGKQWGWMSSNDIRALENMNGIGKHGDRYLQPMNMTDAANPQLPASSKPKSDPNDDSADPKDPKPKGSRANPRAILLWDAHERIAKRAMQDMAVKRRKVDERKMSELDYGGWLGDYMAHELRSYCERVLAPVALAFGESLDELVAEALALPSLDSV